jgi:hypothetical protein
MQSVKYYITYTRSAAPQACATFHAGQTSVKQWASLLATHSSTPGRIDNTGKIFYGSCMAQEGRKPQLEGAVVSPKLTSVVTALTRVGLPHAYKPLQIGLNWILGAP